MTFEIRPWFFHHAKLLMSNGEFQVLEKYVKQGLDINHLYETNYTLLWYACNDQNATAVKWLITHGADVNIGTQFNGFTPLVLAAQTRIEIVQLLLEAGADVNAGNQLNMVAALASAFTGNEEIFHLLMQSGTDINLLFAKNDYICVLDRSSHFCYQYIEEHVHELDAENLEMWKKTRLKSIYK